MKIAKMMLVAMLWPLYTSFAASVQHHGLEELAGIELPIIESQIKLETDKRVQQVMKTYEAGDLRDYLLAKVKDSMERFKRSVLEAKKIRQEIKKSDTPPLLTINKQTVVWNRDRTAVLVVSLVPVGVVEKFGYMKALRSNRQFKTPEWKGVDTSYCWVTLVPQLKEFGYTYIKEHKLFEPSEEKAKDRSWYMKDRIELTDRINEYLGLIPFSEDYSWADLRVVEMWVRPEDLFRPCDNPDPKAEYCTVAPSKHVFLEDVENGEVNFDHSTFLAAKKATAWSSKPFPWTNLGFTYDWGPGAAARNHVGATEFAIKPNSLVIFQETGKTFPSLQFYFVEQKTPKTGAVDIKMPKRLDKMKSL